MKTKTAKGVTFKGQTYRRVVVEYGLSKIGDQKPHFTVTGSAWWSMRREPDVHGTMPELLGKVFPSLRPLIALHLSDVEGVPLHAEANGWYYLREANDENLYAPWVVEGLTREQMAERYLRAPAGYFDGIESREQFAARVEALRPQWLAEAVQAIEKFDLVVTRTPI